MDFFDIRYFHKPDQVYLKKENFRKCKRVKLSSECTELKFALQKKFRLDLYSTLHTSEYFHKERSPDCTVPAESCGGTSRGPERVLWRALPHCSCAPPATIKMAPFLKNDFSKLKFGNFVLLKSGLLNRFSIKPVTTFTEHSCGSTGSIGSAYIQIRI